MRGISTSDDRNKFSFETYPEKNVADDLRWIKLIFYNFREGEYHSEIFSRSNQNNEDELVYYKKRINYSYVENKSRYRKKIYNIDLHYFN